MKTNLFIAAAMLLNLGAPSARAQDSPPAPVKCEMCEMMKKKAESASRMNDEIAELDKLVTEMNGSLGPRKIEAMAAVVTRLVANYKLMAAAAKPAPPPGPSAQPPKEAPAHQH